MKTEEINLKLEKIANLYPIEINDEIIKLSEETKISKTLLNKQLSTIQKKIEKENKKNTIKNLKEKIKETFDKKKSAEEIIKKQPYLYDIAKVWWLWDKKKYKWEKVDETDILNIVDDTTALNTINTKEKTEIIEALKQVSRKNRPKKIKKSWIQFTKKIIDIKTGKTFEASQEYFATNPIPHEIGKSEETPNMDRIFKEWVGENNVQTLYEILAYCLISDYPIHRIFCFIGAGMNGKSKFLELLRKFIGEENCCATELDTLIQSRFEVGRLHKKLVCQMGETNFSEMNKTSILKKLSGGDLIGFEYKGKDLIEENNFAKICISTNNLPATTDKTIGFYRRWMIIDFPNQFSEKKDILEEIPKIEYNNLALKSIRILTELLNKREFTNEGTIEDRIKKYEDHSNPLEKFLKEFTEEEHDKYIFKRNFFIKFNDWCKQNRFRGFSEVEIGKKMAQLKINQALRSEDWSEGKRYPCWMGIKFKDNEEKEETIPQPKPTTEAPTQPSTQTYYTTQTNSPPKTKKSIPTDRQTTISKKI